MINTKSEKPVLYIFSGLPGTGKTTLSQRLTKHINAVYLRIDTIEQSLKEFYSVDIQNEGYSLSYRIASENLHLGMNVVSDSCNPIKLTRYEWEEVAREAQANYINIEVIYSDVPEHRRRIEARNLTELELSWAEVENRKYDQWIDNRIVIDTANKLEEESVKDLFCKLF